MAFFFDKITGKSGFEQYRTYLDNENYIHDLKRDTNDVLNYQIVEVRRAIGNSTEQTRTSFNSLEDKLCGTFENGCNQIVNQLADGFNGVTNELQDINWRLNEINEGISNLHAMLDWKTDLIIEEQKITNIYLGNIEKILGIPDSQLQRSYHVKQGTVYLKNAILEGRNSTFYEDAFEEFNKAKEIEKRDYYCLYNLGLIHLNSLDHLDIQTAENYFKESAKYAQAAANAFSSPDIILRGNVKSYTKDNVEGEVAAAYIYASRCSYILEKFEEGTSLAKKALEIRPAYLEYNLQFAKCLSASNQNENAANILKRIIELNKYYSVKILADRDFLNKPPITQMINDLTDDRRQKLHQEFKLLESLLVGNRDIHELAMNIQYYYRKSEFDENESYHEWNGQTTWETEWQRDSHLEWLGYFKTNFIISESLQSLKKESLIMDYLNLCNVHEKLHHPNEYLTVQYLKKPKIVDNNRPGYRIRLRKEKISLFDLIHFNHKQLQLKEQYIQEYIEENKFSLRKFIKKTLLNID